MIHTTNRFAFLRDYSAAMATFWEAGITPSEKAIAAELAIHRSTLSRMRASYGVPRGSTGLSDGELADLRRGRAANVAQSSSISSGRSTGR